METDTDRQDLIFAGAESILQQIETAQREIDLAKLTRLTEALREGIDTLTAITATAQLDMASTTKYSTTWMMGNARQKTCHLIVNVIADRLDNI